MSVIPAIDEIEYPESDGKPLGESDVHRDWMIRILKMLKYRYRGQRVYVSCDLLVYYQEGDPTKFVVPDDFVVKDCDPGRRRTFKIWKEGKSPDVVFEVTSRGSRRKDQVTKPHIYARLGVKEYFIYDPLAEYLDPPLQGFRLRGNRYAPIKPDRRGMLKCLELAVTLSLDDGDLIMHDAQTGEPLHTEADAERIAREAAEEARDAAEQARQAAVANTAQLQAEIDRLRAELKRKPRIRPGN